MATLSDLIDQVRDHLDEPDEEQWTNVQIRKWINEGVRDVARRGEVVQARATIATVSGTQEYSLPTDIVRIHRVEYQDASNQTTALEYRAFNNMDEVWGTQQRIVSSSRPYWFTLWGTPPTLKIVVYPIPSTTSDTIRVFYYSTPADLATDGSDDADTVTVPQGWEDMVVLYAEYVALRKDRDPRWQEAKQIYEEKISQMIELTRQWSDQAGAITHGAQFLPRWLYAEDY